MLALATVTHADFEPTLNQTYQVTAGNGTFPFDLVDIRTLPRTAPTAKRDPFALIFRSSRPLGIPQGIYRVEHEATGPLEVFLVQTAPTDVEVVFT